jgi:serine phosphatase RsbU (regulator of sigma subunit)
VVVRFTILLIVLLSANFSQTLWASARSEHGPLPLPPLEHLIDPTRDLPFDQAQNSLDWADITSPIVGFEPVDLWVRFYLENSRDDTRHLILEDQWAITDYIQVWVVAGGEVTQKFQVGHKAPSSPRMALHRYPYVPLEIPTGGAWVYVLYRSNDIVGHRLSLWEPYEFERYRVTSQWILGLLMGFIIIMCLYNFCLYLVLRYTAYLFYSLYVAFFSLFQFCFSGLATQFLLNDDYFTDQGTLVFGQITVLFVYFFTRVFLRLPERSPMTSRIGLGIAVFSVGSIPLVFINFQLACLIGITSNLMTASWVIASAVPLALKRVPEAYIFLFAWSLFVLGDVFTILYYIGAAEPSIFSQWGMLVGSVVETVLLSFGLANYVHRMKVEMLAAKVSEADLKGHIKAAGQIQSALLTVVAPAEVVTVASRCRIAEVAAGDWFCVESNSSGDRIYAVIGDVTGHGLSASIVASVVSGAIKSSIHLADTLAIDVADSLFMLIQEANRAVVSAGRQHGHLMSLLLVCCDLRAGKIYYLNAGHLHFLHQHQGAIQTRFTRGSLLGLHDKGNWKVASADLNRGDRILLFTDGLLENTAQSGKGLSQRALNRSMAELKAMTPQNLAAALMREAEQRSAEGQDDVTILVIEVLKLKPKPGSEAA